MNKRILLLLIIIVSMFCSAIAAQDLEERYLSNANSEYLNKNYVEAYQYISFVLNMQKDEEISLPAKILGEKIYYFYIEALIAEKNYALNEEIKNRLETFPTISTARVSQSFKNLEIGLSSQEERIQLELENEKKLEEEALRLEQINKALQEERDSQEELEKIREDERKIFEEKENALQAEIDKVREAEQVRNDQQLQSLQDNISQIQELELKRSEQVQKDRAEYEKRMIEMMEARDKIATEQQEKFNEILEVSLTSGGNSSGTTETLSFYIIIIIAIIGLFLFLGFGLLIYLSVRNSQDSQRRFENTLHTMQNVRPITSINNQFALPDLAESIDNLKLNAPSAQNTQNALPSPDSEQDKFKEMILQCKKYGEQIDLATTRKNNSRNTAELVFKISKEMGFDEKECMLHFSVGLIYDIGFLSIDPEILSRKEINEEEFTIIQNHVNLGLNMIFFIDKQYQPVFRDGIIKHHENLDGTGYPSGLKGEEVPYIARVIHLVESFMSLISTRNYKSIQDKDSAINQLYDEIDKYDQRILEALHDIV